MENGYGYTLFESRGVLYNQNNMAQRRMFSKRIVRTDAFLDLPQTAQNLYFHLGMEADDDGFVNPKMIMRTLGSGDDDLKILIAKNYVIAFEAGVIVITHWKENNYIQKDRYLSTRYERESNEIVSVNGTYTMDIKSIQNVYKTDTQVRLGKVSINNVNGTKEEGRENNEPKTSLHKLPNLERDREEIKLIADDIVAVLGDEHSRPFYNLVAMKIPENVIRQKLAEIKQGGAHSPAKAFTSAMKTYATTNLQRREISALTSATQAMFKI